MQTSPISLLSREKQGKVINVSELGLMLPNGSYKRLFVFKNSVFSHDVICMASLART